MRFQIAIFDFNERYVPAVSEPPMGLSNRFVSVLEEMSKIRA